MQYACFTVRKGSPVNMGVSLTQYRAAIGISGSEEEIETNETYDCRNCTKKFQGKRSLNDHVINVHKE